jgi:parallel beta-helix repeat protein
MFFSFAKRVLSSRFNCPIRRPERARVALGLEPLEERWLPNATVITVTTAADDPTTPIAGQTTLRDAINQANQTTGATIQFAQSLNGQTLQPMATLLLIKGAGTTIDGMGMNITPDGAKANYLLYSSPVFPGDGLDIAASNVTIEGLTIDHWSLSGIRIMGGQWYFGNINVSNTTISNNDIEKNGVGVSVNGIGIAANVSIVGNTISGNGGDGVFLQSNQVEVKGNHIVDNGTNGVEVTNSGWDTIQGNSISGNGGLGILLVQGNNNSITAPVLTSWKAEGSGGAVIEGQLTPPAGAPSGLYTLEFFANTSSSNPQGEQFLGSIQVKASGGATTTFSFTVPSAFSNDSITATVTDPIGDTSEFSNAISASQAPPSDPPGPASSFQAAFTLFMDGAEMLFEQLAAFYTNPNLAGLNASIAANSPYAGPFADWFVLAGEAAVAKQLSAAK